MKNSKHRKIGCMGYIVRLIVGVIIITVIASITLSFNDHTYKIVVTDKERIVEYDGKNTDSKYLIFADSSDGNPMVFENTDNVFRLKFDSSNIQGRLKEGSAYEITVVGVRVPFISMYENIIDVQEIEQFIGEE